MAFNKVVYLAAIGLKIDREDASALARNETACAAFLLEHPQKDKPAVKAVEVVRVEKDFSGITAMTDKEKDKSRTKMQTRYRRALGKQTDASVKADKTSNVYDSKLVKSKASKEKKYNRGSDPAGWNESSQGAGNVVGAKKGKDDTHYPTDIFKSAFIM